MTRSNGSGHGERPAVRPLLLLAAAALAAGLLVVGVVGARSGDDPRETRDRSGSALGSRLPPELAGSPAPEFALRRARGGTIDTRDLRGRPYLVTFLFTDCVDACLDIGQQIRIAFEKLGAESSRVAAVGVSVDPENDTPEAVQAWLRRQRLPDNFHYAVGSKRDLKPTWDAYFAAPKIGDRPETSTHSASIWLIDARGRLRTRYSAGMPLDPEELAGDLRVLLREA